MYCMFGLKTSLETALFAMNLVWIYYEVGVLLNEDCLPRQALTDTSGAIFATAMFVCTNYAMTQDYAKTVIKAVSIFWLLGFSFQARLYLGSVNPLPFKTLSSCS